MLVLFTGVGLEALQIASRTEASSIVVVELNLVAVQCAHHGHHMLERNKSIKCVGVANQLEIIKGNVLKVLLSFAPRSFNRVLVPHPKEGALDGDLDAGTVGPLSLMHYFCY